MSEAGFEPIRILLVEDNADDELIISRAFRKANICNVCHVVRDGTEALDYLFRRGDYADPTTSPRPGLMFLDLNLPKVSGMEVLERIYKDDELKNIPIIVLTVSVRDEDILACYDMGARAFIQKPVEAENLLDYLAHAEDLALYIIAAPTK